MEHRLSFYTGWFAFPKWNIPYQKWKIEPLISIATLQKVQERLGQRMYIPHRNDLREDFPLRGFIQCGECGKLLTASWSKSRNGEKHSYYRCNKKKHDCHLGGKSICKDTLETEFENLLDKMKPSAQIIDLTKMIVKETHKKKLKEFQNNRSKFENNDTRERKGY